MGQGIGYAVVAERHHLVVTASQYLTRKAKVTEVVLWQVLCLHTASAEAPSKGAVVLREAVGATVLATPLKHGLVLLHTCLAKVKPYLQHPAYSFGQIGVLKQLLHNRLVKGFCLHSPTGKPRPQLGDTAWVLKPCYLLGFLAKLRRASFPEAQGVTCQCSIHSHTALVDTEVKQLHLTLPTWLPSLIHKPAAYLHLAIYITAAVLLEEFPALLVLLTCSPRAFIRFAEERDKRLALPHLLLVLCQPKDFSQLTKGKGQAKVRAHDHGVVPLRLVHLLTEVLAEAHYLERHVMRQLLYCGVKQRVPDLGRQLLASLEVNNLSGSAVYAVAEEQHLEVVTLHVLVQTAGTQVHVRVCLYIYQ